MYVAENNLKKKWKKIKKKHWLKKRIKYFYHKNIKSVGIMK